MQNWLKLVISIAAPLTVGFTSSLFNETGEGSWYRSIQKPDWNPPDWIFAPVWTTLYIMMGIALFLVWKRKEQAQRNTAILWFIVQLAMNFFWTFIFFGKHEIAGALVEIIALWLAILITILLFARINKLAAWLMVLYISWVSFAVLLNFAIWQLNR